MTGKQILSQRISIQDETEQHVRLNDQHLATGIYMIRLFNSKNNLTKKLVIH